MTANSIPNQANWTSDGGAYNATEFMVQQLLARVRTAGLVKVITATSAGGLAPAGTVDVQPMVSAIDGHGVAEPHGQLSSLLYLRVQGGGNAIIIDPAPNDIGMAVFCDRDISVVKATKAPATPGSFRRFNMLDGIYFGGMLNGIPTQYLQFIGSKLVLNALTELDLQIGGSTVLAATAGGVSITGTLDVSGDAKINGIQFTPHEHINGGGSGNSGPVAT